MGTIAQYAVSISLFIAIPVGVQWAVGRVTAWRASRAHGELVAVRVAQNHPD